MASNPDNGPALYDDPDFFAAYDDMRAQVGRLNDIVETPALISLMPVLEGITAADLGCGTGNMCRWLLAQNAAHVIGYDASNRMLSRARSQSPNTKNLSFIQADIEQVHLPADNFDLIISGLTLHYVADLKTLTQRITAALKPGGSFILSVEHPVVTCHERAWTIRDHGTRAHWPVDRYLDESSRTIRWLDFERVPREHRTVAGYVNTILDAGMVLKRLLEPGPSDGDIANWPHLADQRRRPPFLIIRADRPA